jgi:hypothetical protein
LPLIVEPENVRQVPDHALPLTLALTAADKVDPVELTAAWTTLARKLELACTAERRPEPSK